jgi:hypothetical protein
MTVVPGGPLAPFSSLEPVSFSQTPNIAAQARACVVLDGRTYAIKSFQISKNAHGATNTASFKLPYASNPDWTNQLFRGTDRTGVTNNSPVYCDLYAGFPPSPGMSPSTSGLEPSFSWRSRPIRRDRHGRHGVSSSIDRVAAYHGSNNHGRAEPNDGRFPKTDRGAVQYPRRRRSRADEPVYARKGLRSRVRRRDEEPREVGRSPALLDLRRRLIRGTSCR